MNSCITQIYCKKCFAHYFNSCDRNYHNRQNTALIHNHVIGKAADEVDNVKLRNVEPIMGKTVIRVNYTILHMSEHWSTSNSQVRLPYDPATPLHQQ